MGIGVVAEGKTSAAPELEHFHVFRVLFEFLGVDKAVDLGSVRVMPGGSAPWDGRSSIVRATCWEKPVEAKISIQPQAKQNKQGNFMLRPANRALAIAKV